MQTRQKLSENAKLVLVAVQARAAVIPKRWVEVCRVTREFREIQQAGFSMRDHRRFGIRYDLADWLNRPPSHSETVSFSRTLKRLEADGLLRRVNCCSTERRFRTTHVRLTEAGCELAKQLFAETISTETPPPDVG
ncbi:helix-turn-helix domain-containing protein [Thalassoroseus pseudoceratinae]|uniref:hypothetical protein n=1 Tax=Thalassoroseus pseudoceratinae TaxID=2713176 RepID=UPI00141FF2A2|nr:hypothetical protein [Thalassoroseus pseudoceratinae]